MTTRRLLAATAVAVVVGAGLAACGSGTGSNDASTSSTQSSIPPLPSTTAPMPASVDFDLLVGENSGRDTMVEVRLGTTVTLRVTPDGAIDEVHIHGYDLYLEDLVAGTAASITFVADLAGTHEVERHDTGEVLMMLRVT